MQRFGENLDQEKAAFLTPVFLEIETFATYHQAWRLLKGLDKYEIDLATHADTSSDLPELHPISRIDRSSNIMNYVLDASGGAWSDADENTRSMARKESSKETLNMLIQMETPSLIALMQLNLGTSMDRASEQTKAWFVEAKPKVEH
jgi:hypothetical protein